MAHGLIVSLIGEWDGEKLAIPSSMLRGYNRKYLGSYSVDARITDLPDFNYLWGLTNKGDVTSMALSTSPRVAVRLRHIKKRWQEDDNTWTLQALAPDDCVDYLTLHRIPIVRQT